MGLSEAQLRAGLDALAAVEPAFAAGLARVGYPAPRIRARGYDTLLRTIIGQQVSVQSANAVYRKLAALVGNPSDPHTILAASDETLRAAGLSRQKASYARSLAEEVTSGRLDLDNLPADDEEAIAQLVRVKGIGRWSAEIYLLFAAAHWRSSPGTIMARDRTTRRRSEALPRAAWPHRRRHHEARRRPGQVRSHAAPAFWFRLP